VAASFDTVSQEWLIRFVEHRVGDKRIIRLIQKWLKAGVLEDGVVTVTRLRSLNYGGLRAARRAGETQNVYGGKWNENSRSVV